MKLLHHPFTLSTVGICIVLFLPALFMNGMFQDGIQYEKKKKNYALGMGTFWSPYFSQTHFPAFHEQPPLLFFLQGFFFKMLGTGMYTERVYCVVAALLNCFLIYHCWKIVSPSDRLGWLPVFFWFIMPVTFYSLTNNLEENTMSIFVLAAMVHLLRALHEKKRETLHLLVAGVWIVLAGLTKGIQGMFLLGTPFIWWLCFRSANFFVLLRQQLFVFIPTLLFFLYAWFTPLVHAAFEAYFTSRFGNTFNHVHDTSDSRFHLLFELLLDTLPVLCMSAFLLVVLGKKTNLSQHWKNFHPLLLFFTLTALTGILPLLITLEQRGFYLVTALPYIALAAALLVAPMAQFLDEKLLLHKRLSSALSIFGMVIIIGGIVATITLAGTPHRDYDKLHDLPLIATKVEPHTTVFTTTAIDCDWAFLTLAMRYYDWSFTDQSSIPHQWLLLEKQDQPPVGYQLVPLPTERYCLYKKQP